MTFWKEPDDALLDLLLDLDAGSKMWTFDTDDHLHVTTFIKGRQILASEDFWDWYLEPVMDQISRSIHELVHKGSEVLFYAPEPSLADKDPFLVITYGGRAPFTLTILKETVWMSKGGFQVTRDWVGATEVSGMRLTVETMMEVL